MAGAVCLLDIYGVPRRAGAGQRDHVTGDERDRLRPPGRGRGRRSGLLGSRRVGTRDIGGHRRHTQRRDESGQPGGDQ